MFSKLMHNTIQKDRWLHNGLHEFNLKNLNLLYQNKIPCILIPNFISDEKCNTILKSAKEQGLDYYEGTSPRVGKIGATQYEHSFKSKFPYFLQAFIETQKRKKMVNSCKFDPLKLVFDLFEKEGMPIKVMTENEYCDYYVGLFRFFEPGAFAYIHFDYAPYDGKNWAIEKISQQISFNVYLKLPKSGGEIVVYNKQWERDKYNKYRLPESTASYGFSEDMVKDVEYFEYAPKKGDLYFFNSRNFHEVKKGDDYRFSMSSFIGRENEKNHQLYMWN